MVGNGTSPTSAATTTASLSGTSQTSLNSSGSSSRLRTNLDQKKQASSALNENSEQASKAKIEVEEPSAPIATINDEDFKLDGGETTKVSSIQNVSFEFCHFPQIFVLEKLTCLVTLFDQKLSHFWHFQRTFVY